MIGNWWYKRKEGDSTRQRSTVRSVIRRRDKVRAYRAKIQSRFSRKQSLKRKIFILYFRLLFLRRITAFPLVPPVTNHPVKLIFIMMLYLINLFLCFTSFIETLFVVTAELHLLKRNLVSVRLIEFLSIEFDYLKMNCTIWKENHSRENWWAPILYKSITSEFYHTKNIQKFSFFTITDN